MLDTEKQISIMAIVPSRNKPNQQFNLSGDYNEIVQYGSKQERSC